MTRSLAAAIPPHLSLVTDSAVPLSPETGRSGETNRSGGESDWVGPSRLDEAAPRAVVREEISRQVTALANREAVQSRAAEPGTRPDLTPGLSRVQGFLARYFAPVSAEAGVQLALPATSEVLFLVRPGMARELSLPDGGDRFQNSVVQSFGLANGQGILHNTVNDKRTTVGIFHIAEGGPIEIPANTKAVPAATSARLVHAALNPGWRPSGENVPSDRELMVLPWTWNPAAATDPRPTANLETMVALYARPTVSPEVPGVHVRRNMEITVIAPGGMVSNLDFLEGVFGNAGDSTDPRVDAGLDPKHWSGQSALIVFAPHLTKMTKRELGLPHFDDATDRQRADGMCWKDPTERYNDGTAFKLCIRDHTGASVMVVANNYFGYGKKGYKDLMSRACNMLGLVEELHAGGAIAYPSYDLGETFDTSVVEGGERWLRNVFERYPSVVMPVTDGETRGYGIHREDPTIIFVPHGTVFDAPSLTVTWSEEGVRQSLRLNSKNTYVLPNGLTVTYRPESKVTEGATYTQWRLIGTLPEGVVLHKSDSVSGAGKSEIAKALEDAMTKGFVTVGDFEKAMREIRDLADRTFPNRFRPEELIRRARRGGAGGEDTDLKGSGRGPNGHARKPFENRTLGSLIKLFTVSEQMYTDEHNELIRGISPDTKALLFRMKELYPNHGMPLDEFFGLFSTKLVDGRPAGQVFFRGQPLFCDRLRVGHSADKQERLFSLRPDYVPAVKFLREDDISLGRTVPASSISNLGGRRGDRVSEYFVENAETELFQRPDGASKPGNDKVAERDFARRHGFFTNYEPLPVAAALAAIEDEQRFSLFTPPVQHLYRLAAAEARAGRTGYFVSPAHPRLVGGRPTENPRYLQPRPDLLAAEAVAERAFYTRMARRISVDAPLPSPVDVLVPGRRLNRADAPQRSLAVLGPITVQELPELIMELFTSLTGKSRSTTGNGSSEGGRTKGPFNQLPDVVDVENALVTMILTGKSSFISAAGWVGPKYNVDHDISLLIPELFARLEPEQRTFDSFKARGWLEPVEDFTVEVREGDTTTSVLVPASRLGWRLSPHGRDELLGRIFESPGEVFPLEMLRPELQDRAEYVDGVMNIVDAQKRIAELHFRDNTVELACPPVCAVLHMMRDGYYDDPVSGARWTPHSPEFRAQFTLEALLSSDWYKARLGNQQLLDSAVWNDRVRDLEASAADAETARRASEAGVDLGERQAFARAELERVSASDYPEQLVGTIGLHGAVMEWRRRASAGAPG